MANKISINPDPETTNKEWTKMIETDYLPELNEYYQQTRSARLTGEKFFVSGSTVINILRRNGYPIFSKGGPRNKIENRAEIYRYYRKCKSPARTARKFGISRMSVLNIAREHTATAA